MEFLDKNGLKIKRPRLEENALKTETTRNLRPKRTSNSKKNANFDQENDGICWIDTVPSLILIKIFENLDYRNRLRLELVSRRWRQIAKEESWRHFSQCCLPKFHSFAHLAVLFDRCGQYIRELIFAPNSPEGKVNQFSVGHLSNWVHLMPKLETICIVDRQLGHREKCSVNFIDQLQKIKCLYLDGCLQKTQQKNNFGTMRLLVGECTSLLYLALTKSRYRANSLADEENSHNEAHCQIGSKTLRQLKIDDSFDIQGILMQTELSELIGLSLSFSVYQNFIQLCQHPNFPQIFRRLNQFELAFYREPDKNVLDHLEKMIPCFENIKILSLEYIDGNILSKIVRHCPNIEQFEYLSHKANILDTFPQICQFKNLRFLWIRHYSEAKPKEMPELFLETLKELAAKGKLEHLSLNVKLPMDLVLHIVRECPFLDYLEYSQAPANLTELSSTLHQLCQTRNSSRPLNFRILYNHFWKRKHSLKAKNGQQNEHSPWLKLRHQPPRRESAVMKEHLKRVFEGSGHIPEFLTIWLKPDEDGEL